MLVADGICKTIGREQLLSDATLSLASGELVGLIGASGAGKTVFARCMVGLETWDSGSLRVDDLLIAEPHAVDDPAWRPVRRLVGLVAQNRALPPYRTARDQILEGPRFVGGVASEHAATSAAPWIERLGLKSHLDKYPAELSGGQVARVCLARALVMEPRYLICDELTAPLDPAMAAEVATALLEVVKAGVGVLMISHQLEFLRRFATRVDYLHAGRIIVSGDAASTLLNPTNDALRQFLSGSELGR